MSIALMLVVLGCIAAYITYPIFRATRIDKKLMQTTVPYEQHVAGTSMRILVAGDSTGVGTGTRDAKYSTAGRLGKLFPTATISNISENGLKIDGLRQKLTQLDGDYFDLALIQIGANDVIRYTSLDEIRSGVASVLATITTLSNRTIILTSGNIGLAPIFRWPLSQLYANRTREVRRIFLEEIAKHATVTYVDLYREPIDDELSKDIPRYYASDLLHLSDDGYGVWFKEIVSTAKL